MKCIDLCDSFMLEGKELDEFIDVVNELADSTIAMPMETEQMDLLPVVDANVLKNSFIPSLSFSGIVKPAPEIINQEIICLGRIQEFFSDSAPALEAISLKQVLEKGGSRELFYESKDKSMLFIRYNEQLYFTSPQLPETLCARVKIHGDAIYDTSVERTAFVMRRLKKEPQTVTALIRVLPGTGIRKVMILGSKNYKYIPQTFFKRTIDTLRDMAGEPKCQSWKVDHFVSTIYLEFPDLAKQLSKDYQLPDEFVPGICLTTSDTYDASLSARPTWRIGEATVEGPGILVEHDGKADIAVFNRKIKTEIIDRYPKFLQRMQHFQELCIADPESTLSHLFTRLKIMKAVGKKRTLRLIPERADHLNQNQSVCHAYELVVNLLQLPADCTLPESPAVKLRRAVYDAVFLDDKQYVIKANGRAG